MPLSISPDTGSTIQITAGVDDDDAGIRLRVDGDDFDRIALTPDGQVLRGDGTAEPEPVTAFPVPTFLELGDIITYADGVTDGGDYGNASYVTPDGSELVISMDIFKTTALTKATPVTLGTLDVGYRPPSTRWSTTLGDVRVDTDIIVGQFIIDSGGGITFVPFDSHASGDCDFECYGVRVVIAGS